MGIDTHKAVKTLTGAGFSETQAEALIETIGETDDALATKADVQELARTTSEDIQQLARTTSEDIQQLARTTSADIQELAHATSAEFAAVRAEFISELKDLELRLEQRLNRQTIQLAGLAIAAGGVVVAILKWFP
ncbi:MAG: hypothetical protein OXK81_01820 [Chloroflexota bacterium]|nr:hypothetical protein [Chloroflexota bacterium]